MIIGWMNIYYWLKHDIIIPPNQLSHAIDTNFFAVSICHKSAQWSGVLTSLVSIAMVAKPRVGVKIPL